MARLHYEHGLTHQQIADLVGVSRVKVTRLLAEARRTGVVEIRVHSDEPLFTELELELATHVGLDRVLLAPSSADEDAQLDALGAVGARSLRSLLVPDATVAVGLSASVAAMARHLRGLERPDTRFVPATGTWLPDDGAPQHDDVAQALARAVGARSSTLPAPVLTATEEAASHYLQEPAVRDALARARRADVAVVGIGGVTSGSSLLLDTSLPPDTVEQLIAAGAVGGIVASFHDDRGQPIATDLARRIVGLTVEQLHAIPVRLGVAGGPAKRAAVAGALRGRHLTALVTDHDTARWLLGHLDRISPAG
ncbi:MAG: helix-turn-helix domain-containing protein [Nitriliruptoraceae bacterium]|nr:helix-turn-helix domain-containing protein [Nitriliruptoraceae bacterium]